jgi:hypothetical protein
MPARCDTGGIDFTGARQFINTASPDLAMLSR